VAKNLKLKLARVELDLTQGQLAEAVGGTRQTIGLIEGGGKKVIKWLFNLGKAFKGGQKFFPHGHIGVT